MGSHLLFGPPSLLPGLESKRSEWMGGLPSAMTHLYAGGCFSSLIPRFSPFILCAAISRLLFFSSWFLQVSLLPLSPSFASSPPLPSDVCPSPPPSAFDAVISLKVKIASVSFSCRFCLLTSAGISSNKQHGGNTTAVRTKWWTCFSTKLFGVCVMKHANEARSHYSVKTLFLSNLISTQQPRSTKGPVQSFVSSSGKKQA